MQTQYYNVYQVLIRAQRYSSRLIPLYPRRTSRQNLRRRPPESVIRICRGSASAAGPWVRLVVHLGEVLKIEMGVDLRGRDIGMTEQLLNGAQIGTRF